MRAPVPLRRLPLAVLLATSAAAAAAVVGGCEAQREMTRSHSVLMSTVKEESLGEEAAGEVEGKLGFIGDEDIQQYAKEIGSILARNSPRREVRYQFDVVEMIEPNAFALPGGYVYVSRGLLALVNSEQELANVLAHEVAHVALQHHAYRELEVRKTKAIGLLAVLAGAVAGGPQGAIMTAQGWMVAGQGMLAAYSRDQEREADALGQEIARNAGWDPLAMASFLRSLDRYTRLQHGSSRLTGYFDTHPGSIERVAKAAIRYEHAAPLSDDQRGRAHYLEKVDGLVVGPNPDEGVFVGSRFLHPGLDISLRFPEGWHTINEHSAVRAVSPRRTSMVILEMQGRGDDPEASAREYAEKVEAPLEQTRSGRVNGNPTFQAETAFEIEGKKVKVHVTWIAHGGNIYRIMGAIQPGNIWNTEPFGRVARSFRSLTGSERDAMKVTRLRSTGIEEQESLEEISLRTRNVWSRDETAVMNGLAVDEALVPGDLVKVAVPEPWVPRD